MTSPWYPALLSVFAVSLLSFAGIFTLSLGERRMRHVLLMLVSFSAGALLGDAFIHILPEIVEESGWTLSLSVWILFGIVIFFILEKFIHWHHHHHVTEKCDDEHGEAVSETRLKPFAVTNLVADLLHNIIDGAIVAGAYVISIPLGIATTVAVALHEIPQEIGDFSVLLHAGLKPKKALFFNFLSALGAVLGAVIVLGFGMSEESVISVLLPLTAGGFIYIAATDLIPEMHKETKVGKSIGQLVAFIVGIGLMFGLTMLE